MSGPNGRKEHIWCSTARLSDIRAPAWIFVGLGNRSPSAALAASTVWCVCPSASPCASRGAFRGHLAHPADLLRGLPNVRRRRSRVAGRVHLSTLCNAAFPRSQQGALLTPRWSRASAAPQQLCRCRPGELQWLQRRQHRHLSARAAAWPLRTTRLSRRQGAAVSTRRTSHLRKKTGEQASSGRGLRFVFYRRRGHRHERAHDQQSEQLSIVSDSFRYFLIMSDGLPIVPRAGRYVPIVCREFTDSRTHMSKCVQYKVCTLVKQMCQIVQ